MLITFAVFAAAYIGFSPKATEGSKNITIEVINSAEESTVYEVATDAEYLVEALGCEEVSNKKGVMEDLIIAYEYAGDFDLAWNVMQEYATSYTLTADLEREYIFLENRQMKEEVEEATEPETEEGTEASDTESVDTESSQTPEGEGTTAE